MSARQNEIEETLKAIRQKVQAVTPTDYQRALERARRSLAEQKLDPLPHDLSEQSVGVAVTGKPFIAEAQQRSFHHPETVLGVVGDIGDHRDERLKAHFDGKQSRLAFKSFLPVPLVTHVEAFLSRLSGGPK